MNPLTNMKNVLKLSEQELHTSNRTSWHDQYRDSAWVFIGGLPYDLTEGDIVCIFSQYGEIVNINLIRDKDSGKSKGFCFLCYEDQRSTILAVDNFNGIKILNRIIRVDHVSNYKVPKQGKKTDEETKRLYDEGCAPKAVPIQTVTKRVIKADPDDFRETLADQIKGEINLPARLPIYTVKKEKFSDDEAGPAGGSNQDSAKKDKKKKKDRKKKKKRKKSSDSDSSDSESEKKKSKTKKRSRSRSPRDKHPRQQFSKDSYRKQDEKSASFSAYRRRSRSRSPNYRKYK